MDLNTKIRYIKGVGEAREKRFSKLGVSDVRELVSYFPRTYEDRTRFSEICDLVIGEAVCVRAMAAAKPQLSHIRKGLDIVKLRVFDDTGELEITFFNQAYIKDAIKQGETYTFFGKVTGTLLHPAMANPIFEKETPNSTGETTPSASRPPLPRGELTPNSSLLIPNSKGSITGRIMPVYALTAGISQKVISNAVRAVLDKCGDNLPDILPESIVKQHELCRARFAYENIHFPADFKALEIARKRLIFEELFVLAAAMKLLRGRRGEETGQALVMRDFDAFYKALDFEPTSAQIRAINEAARDMAAEKPMSRLIQGDVGSGKTLVAAACCWLAWKSDCQSAFMAPTEILAKQHYRSLTLLLEPMGMRIALLTGSLTAKRKSEVYEKLANGEIDLLIGTHALISEAVRFKNLALVITDEQHRFGVNQRSLLTEKGDSPHVMVMSATPIPRTLALIIYGDLDVSIIDEMPPGRQKIETYAVSERHRQRVYAFVKKLAAEGRQAYIICPMVEEGEMDDEGNNNKELKAAREYSEKLQNTVFPNLRVSLVHGKMAAKLKDAAMKEFSEGLADILVATTVVEVGVDVPNAALMLVENADRFGLSQLHQLRGRVGRGEHKSYCILFQGAAGENSRERLEIMCATNDGFKIAEEDLKLRGPGDFLGSRQHGLPEMRIANFASDMNILAQAQKTAEDTLAADPHLKADENRKLAAQIETLFEINAGKFQ